VLKRLTIIPDNLDHASKLVFTDVDLEKTLTTVFPGKFPDNGRIYHGNVCLGNDVTPHDQASIDKLLAIEDELYVIVFPGWVALPYLFAVGVAAAAYLLAPSVPEPPPVLARNEQSSSPNNELSDRANRARINGRIPDIYGTVRSTPDLIAAPYKIFENNREVEYAFMCVGRGPYDIDDVRDGDTLVRNIPGSTIQVYAPYTSPNRLGDTPELTIGTPIQVPLLSARRSNSVNGQVLRPPNTATFTGIGNVRFTTPNVIELFPNNVEDFTKFFVEGDTLTITDATMTAGVPVNESVTCWATETDRHVVFTVGRAIAAYDYAFAPGSLVFEIRNEDAVNGLFTAGASIVLTQTFGPVGIDLSGTYDILTVEIIDPKTDPANTGSESTIFTRADAPAYLVVQLDSPVSVNSDWNLLNDSDNFNRMNLFVFSVGHEAGQSYNLNLNGTYTIVSVTKEVITLDDPVSVNGDWATVATHGSTPWLSPTLTSAGDKWIGPFILTDTQLHTLYCNFVAQQGLYKDDGLTQEAASVEIEVEAWPVDEDDVQLFDSETFRITMLGSTTLKETLSQTLKARFTTFYGRTAVRARRVTETDEVFDGQVVDEVRWRDVYSIASVGEQVDFGNVTTVQSVTFATASALAVKERKLNMLVSRRIPTFAAGALTSTLAASSEAWLIFAAICRDRYLGNRSVDELDLQAMSDTADEVETYFGTDLVRYFNYTFDKDNTSFEEMANSVANAMFCTPYRRGNVIRLSFEKETDDSVLLFNHRNKVPGTERRSISFGGPAGDYDGVEYTYVDPSDDSINTVFIPPDFAAVNPKKVESVGVRNHLQAYFHVWRIWNRMQYQNMSIQFEALQEAEIILRNDRILVTDGTRSGTQDGEVFEVDGTELTLSQEVDLTADPPYTIFLQHYDGSVESLGITAGTNANQVVLEDPPLLPLVTEKNMSVRTGYIIVGATEPRQLAFLVSEKEPEGPITTNVKAINYDARYYSNDTDFINELIDENGYGETGGFTPTDPGDTGYPGPDANLNPAAAFTMDSAEAAIGYAIDNSGAEYPNIGTSIGVIHWNTVASAGGAGALTGLELTPGLVIGFVADVDDVTDGGFIVRAFNIGEEVDELRILTVTINGTEYHMADADDTDGAYSGFGYYARYWRWATPAGLADGVIYPIDIRESTFLLAAQLNETDDGYILVWAAVEIDDDPPDSYEVYAYEGSGAVPTGLTFADLILVDTVSGATLSYDYGPADPLSNQYVFGVRAVRTLGGQRNSNTYFTPVP
jgi:hypothetical protein